MKINCDLHIHSCLSPCGDSDMTPNNIVNMAVLLGLDAIAVSDHNTAMNVHSVIKAAQTSALTVIPAIEICSSEEVHLLCLFYDEESAVNVSNIIYNYLPDIKNKPEFFGEQIVMDQNDNTISREERLLINALTIDISHIISIVSDNNGLVIPAHVDKSSYSIISNLGAIPKEYGFNCIEIYDKNSIVNFDGKIISDSDAHYLENMRENANIFDLKENSVKAILDYLKYK